MRTMYDAVDANDVPSAGFDLLAGYTNGDYRSYGPLQKRFPGKTVVSIDVLNIPGSGQVLDIEKGDATPEEAPIWFDKSHALHVIRPTLYYSASLHNDILDHMGDRHFDAWIAAYGDKECPIKSTERVTVVAWQKINHGPHGENIDISDVFDDYWPLAEDDMFTDEDRERLMHIYNFQHGLDLVAQSLGYQSYADYVQKTGKHAG